MSDIVERLREGSWGIAAKNDEECMQKMNDLALEAASTIERLTAENKRLKALAEHNANRASFLSDEGQCLSLKLHAPNRLCAD